MKTGAVILAAGSSSRMGQPKQLLKIGEQSLIQKITETVLSCDFEVVSVVLGAYQSEIYPIIKKHPVLIAENKEYQLGMGGSISLGVQKVLSHRPDLDHIIVLLCDQVNVSKETLEALVLAQELSGKAIIASQYGKTIGVPALFGKVFFEKLMQLNQDEGARKIIGLYSDQVHTIPFPEGAEDLDTWEDYQNYLKKNYLQT